MSKIFDNALAQVSDDVKRFVDNSIQIANQIHSILERQGKTQRDLANLLGKKESEISKWLTGTHNFTLKSVTKIESVLNEKIITTPLHSEHIFLTLAENALKLFEARSSNYLPVIKNDYHTAFLEVTRNTRRKKKYKANGDTIIEQEQSYAMVA